MAEKKSRRRAEPPAEKPIASEEVSSADGHPSRVGRAVLAASAGRRWRSTGPDEDLVITEEEIAALISLWDSFADEDSLELNDAGKNRNIFSRAFRRLRRRP